MHDVIILGGGLAGLTLALQIKQVLPDLKVRVVERRHHPVPHAAHKIGESSVEIGAHYFSQTLGLQAHLDQAHLRKFGFRFFFSEGQKDLSAVTELGASRFLTTPSWQIDRGIFENFLAQEALRRGIEVECGTAVRQIKLDGAAGHEVTVERLLPISEERAEKPPQDVLKTRWVIDAAGRVSLLKRQLQLSQDNNHHANAVWFRLKTRLPVDAWGSDPAWQARCDPQSRWLSTNHLCGPGYWLWLIPLGSGAHSLGIVADARMHPLEEMNTFERAREWIAKHQPLIDEVLTQIFQAQPDALMDFAFFRQFSYGCKQVFSGQQRWALTGDAGLFLDPFYSPGSDFIAIANTFITDLIQKDLQGESLRIPAILYEDIYQTFYESTLTLYTDQYPLFGNPRVMPVKVLWDYTYYWGVMCQLFFQNRLTQHSTFTQLQEPLNRAKKLNAAMQTLMRHWGDDTQASVKNPARMLDQASLPWFAELNRGLRDKLDDAAFEARMEENVALLERVAGEITAMALSDAPALREFVPSGITPSSTQLFLFPALFCAEHADASDDGKHKYIESVI
jgi:flavin-dependent dehydrogenase